jgi:DNA-binding NarL/FixJ family response regulator
MEVPAAVREHKPDVVPMDLRMPVLDAIGATQQLVDQLDHRPKVVVVTTFERREGSRSVALANDIADVGHSLLLP